MAKKKSAAPKGCNCVAQVQKQLAERNCALTLLHSINFTTMKTASNPQVVLHKIDPKVRKGIPSLQCTFCPFCGRKL